MRVWCLCENRLPPVRIFPFPFGFFVFIFIFIFCVFYSSHFYSHCLFVLFIKCEISFSSQVSYSYAFQLFYHLRNCVECLARRALSSLSCLIRNAHTPCVPSLSKSICWRARTFLKLFFTKHFVVVLRPPHTTHPPPLCLLLSCLAALAKPLASCFHARCRAVSFHFYFPCPRST